MLLFTEHWLLFLLRFPSGHLQGRQWGALVIDCSDGLCASTHPAMTHSSQASLHTPTPSTQEKPLPSPHLLHLEELPTGALAQGAPCLGRRAGLLIPARQMGRQRP